MCVCACARLCVSLHNPKRKFDLGRHCLAKHLPTFVERLLSHAWVLMKKMTTTDKETLEYHGHLILHSPSGHVLLSPSGYVHVIRWSGRVRGTKRTLCCCSWRCVNNTYSVIMDPRPTDAHLIGSPEFALQLYGSAVKEGESQERRSYAVRSVLQYSRLCRRRCFEM